MKKIGLYVCVLMLLVWQTAGMAAGTPKAVLDARKSVVRIVVETPYGEGIGSGFAVGNAKPVQYIVTNHHVVEDAEKISVLLGRDNFIEANIVTALPASDLAILKVVIPLHQIEPAVLSSKTVREGTKGYALGYPFASDQFSETITGNTEDITITDGIVSTLQTVPFVSGMQPVKIYQINAALNEGNSGGPFVNSNGEVIGINSWGIAGANDINAAIRVEELTAVLAQNGVPYLQSSQLSLVKLLIVAAGILFIAAVVCLVVFLVKRNKKAKGVLYGVSGELSGRRFYLPDEGINIGRDATICQVVVPRDSAKVSRSHCNIRYDINSQTFILTDLSSSNGTYLFNGLKLEAKKPTTLANGTKFYLGDETIAFRVGIEE